MNAKAKLICPYCSKTIEINEKLFKITNNKLDPYYLMGKLIAIHGNMPNDYLNEVIGESIDIIEKLNQRVIFLEANK